jgi:Ca2+-binding EF-hand superfamily protein
MSEISAIKNNFNNNYLNEPSLSYQPSISNLSQYSNITNATPKDLKSVVGPISKRDISLRQLLEIINDIYNSKLENDKKLVNNRQQKLTMEQFLYHYLNNKYGLKNLVIEYASCIIQGIKDFSKKNSEILLFGKILRNEIEEQEILIISKLKETINELLTIYYQNKFQYKSKKDIENMVKKCKTGLLNEEQWKNIVAYLFSDNENDLNNLMEKIERYITRQNSAIETNQKFGNSVSYQKFIQLIIDYQIRIRSIYLKNFNQIFKSIDTDRDGIITDYDFVKLVEIANVYNTREELETKTQTMIKELDKYSNGTITYNDIINLWNNEMTFDQITGENLSLLDKLSME